MKSKRMRKFAVILVILIFLPMVMALTQSFNVQIADDGLEIIYPKIATHQQSKDIDFHFFVLNKSDGAIMDNTTTSCSFYLHNSNGSHLAEREVMDYAKNYAFEISLNGNNFSKLGRYSYITLCNTSNLGGAVSVAFEVTGTGDPLNIETVILYLGLLTLLIFLFIINLVAIFKLPTKDNYDLETGQLISINQLKYLRPILYMISWLLLVSIFFVGSNLAFAYLKTALIGSLLFKIFYIMMGLTLPIIVILFIYIFQSYQVIQWVT